MTNNSNTSSMEKIRHLRSVTERLFSEGKIVARSDNSVNEISPIGINSVQGEALRSWVVKEKAVNTIEIGLAWGISALYICEGLLENGDQNAHHIAIDPLLLLTHFSQASQSSKTVDSRCWMR